MTIEQLVDDFRDQLSVDGIDFVPDPMILRVAELFLLGRTGAEEVVPLLSADEIWETISRNIDGLLAFFHLVMTRDRVPLIDYEDTFPGNRLHELLRPAGLPVWVHPPRDLYHHLADRATDQLAGFEVERLPSAMLDDIVDELGTTGYDWYPGQHQFEELTSSGARVASTFAVGGLIFGGYANAAGVDHLLQTKRARLFVELAMPTDDEPRWGFDQEAELYRELHELVGRDPAFEIDDQPLPPSVLPLMIVSKDPQSPSELLQEVFELRTTRAGAAFRDWHQTMRYAWAQGRHDVDAEAAVADVAGELRSRLAPRDGAIAGVDLTVSAGVGVGLGLIGPVGPNVGLAIEREVRVGVPDRLRNWYVDLVRFRKHKKLLLRMSLAQSTFAMVTRRLEQMWRTS